MNTIQLNDNELRRFGALVSYLLMAPRFFLWTMLRNIIYRYSA